MAKVKVLNEKLHIEGVWHDPGAEVEIEPPALDNLLRDSRVELIPEPEKKEEGLSTESGLKPEEQKPA